MLVNHQDENNFDIRAYSLNPSNFINNKHSNLLTLSVTIIVTHVNIRSLIRNIGELSFLYEYSLASKFYVIAVSEVWNVHNVDTLAFKAKCIS